MADVRHYVTIGLMVAGVVLLVIGGTQIFLGPNGLVTDDSVAVIALPNKMAITSQELTEIIIGGLLIAAGFYLRG